MIFNFLKKWFGPVGNTEQLPDDDLSYIIRTAPVIKKLLWYKDLRVFYSIHLQSNYHHIDGLLKQVDANTRLISALEIPLTQRYFKDTVEVNLDNYFLDSAGVPLHVNDSLHRLAELILELEQALNNEQIDKNRLAYYKRQLVPLCREIRQLFDIMKNISL